MSRQRLVIRLFQTVALGIAAGSLVLVTACTPDFEAADMAAPPSGPDTGASSTARTPAPDSRSFVLYVHCGLRFADFDGRAWEALEPISNPTPQQRRAQRWESVNELRGTMTRLGPDAVRFEWQDGPEGWEQGTADFGPAGEPPAPCA